MIPDADGNFTRPLNLRKRVYTILDEAKIEKKGLHSLRHTFATKLVTGVRAEDGSVKALTPRQVADLLEHNFGNNRNVLCQTKHGYADGRYKRV